ncbi:MAG: gamma-glutamyl-gamma-aminobutyrate hydrolase family protein [Blastochloris sp.]|nr:gamma-glutamyl-gamma-aminobutyrate hydrolase family protein [Blastochloris sp.]
MKALIGISCGTFHDRDWCPPSFGHRQTYVDAILHAGGAPMLIPPVQDEVTLRALYERLDGVLFAGGGDIAPQHYSAEPHAKLGPIDALRDFAELPMARWAIADGKPVFGICRGIQVINVALGGTLYQDLPSQISSDLQHNLSYEREDWTHLAHEMRMAPNSLIADLLGVEAMPINSLHHQAVRDIAPGLRATAWAPDGVVEALEGTADAFLLGVQCHPEALQARVDTRWQAVFAAFVARCASRQNPSALAA